MKFFYFSHRVENMPLSISAECGHFHSSMHVMLSSVGNEVFLDDDGFQRNINRFLFDLSRLIFGN